MITNGFLEYDKSSLAVRPLAELPTLRLVDSARDVRGWEVRARDGRPLGTVVDLLVDIDRLRADTLLVSVADAGRDDALIIVPLQALAPERGGAHRLMLGEGMAPIALRYESTTRYALGGAIVVALLVLAAWILGFLR